MPSQFFGLNTAYKGLLASNAALNTTANNISNVQTEGYSRQSVKQQASDAIRVFQTYGSAGAGVETLAIERIHNDFYDGKFREASTTLGEYEMKQYYMKQVETYFADDGKTGFTTLYNAFTVSGLQELLKNPGSTSAKAQFIGSAGNLTEYFHNMHASLQKVQKDVNQEIKLRVDELNSIASEIATIDKQINVIELTGARANELRDRRDVLLDQLSKIVNIETQEIPLTDPHDPERETGATRFLVKIAGGSMLVDSSDYKQLECVARPIYEKAYQSDIDGLYNIQWSNGDNFDMYNPTLGGELQGLIEMRDGNNKEYFSGTITAVGQKSVTGEDGTAVPHDTVTIEVSEQYLQDLNKCNLSDSGGIINLGNKLFYYDSWSYTCTMDGAGNATYSYEFVLSDSELNSSNKLTNDRIGKLASIGTAIDYQGIPYYMSQMNEWVRTYSQKVNDVFTSGYNSEGTSGTVLFAAHTASDTEQYVMEDAYRYDIQKSGTMTVDMADASYYKMTAGNFETLTALSINADLLGTKINKFDGNEQNDLLKKLQSMFSDKEQISFRGCTAGEFLNCVLSDVALNASNANAFTNSYTNITGSIQNQRLSISGVDEDEEAVNLVKFQNAYNLSSKMIQVLTEIYDRLITQTGV